MEMESSSGNVENGQAVDIIGNLHPAAAHEILMYLSPHDLCNAWTCSSTWRDLMNYDYFWKKKGKRDKFYSDEEIPQSKFYEENFNEGYTKSQKAYLYSQLLNRNWKNNYFLRYSCEYEGFKNKIHQLDGEILTLSTSKGLIVNIDCVTKESKTIFNTRETVEEVKQSGNVVSYCNANYERKAFSQAGFCLLIAKEYHRKYAQPISVADNLVYFVDNETLKVMGYRTYAFMDNVNTVCCCNGLVAIGRTNGIIRIVKEGSTDFFPLMEFGTPKNRRMMEIQISGKFMIAISYKEMEYDAYGWDIEYQTFLNQLVNFSKVFIEKFLLSQNKLYYVQNNKINIWDIITGELLSIDHQHPIDIMKANSRYLFTYCYQTPYINLWCKDTGDLFTRLNLGVSRDYKIQNFFVNETKLAYLETKMTCQVLHIHNYEKKFGGFMKI